MPTFDQISLFISDIGFPIFTCLLLLYFMRETLKEQSALLSELKSSIENNTTAINRLTDKAN